MGALAEREIGIERECVGATSFGTAEMARAGIEFMNAPVLEYPLLLNVIEHQNYFNHRGKTFFPKRAAGRDLRQMATLVELEISAVATLTKMWLEIRLPRG